MDMTDDGGSPESRSDTEAEAIAWFTRMNGRPSRADRKHFRAWLDADEKHRRVYEEIRALWSSAEAPGSDVAREEAAALAKHLESVRSMREQKRFGKASGIVAICLFFLLAGSWIWLEKPTLLQDMRADYVSPRGERRSISLEDGSAVLLDADSAMNVDITGAARRVRLLRGTAFFTVEPSDVPFLVEAASGESRVLGTEFDVAMGDRDVSVTLASGSLLVRVEAQSRQIVLQPGEEVAYDEAGPGPARKVDLTERMAWHEGRYVFTNARLADVLHRIERYRGGRILVLGSALADRRVSGSFSVNDADAALASVQSSVGFRMNRIGGRVVIVGP